MATALLDSLKKSIGKKKSNSQAFAWLADLERESGDLNTALERVDGGLTLYPSDVPAMLVRSTILFQKGDFEGCITECERVLKYDPFCLSAQKRMGDAYEQLGNENERNKCYRRVHDMDPLDTFWKEEYDHVEETVVAAAAAAAMSDSDFAMPDDFTMDASAAPQAAETATAEPAAESATEPAATDAATDASDEEDPFAAFASLAATQDSGEESAMDSLQSSLDSAMQDFLNDEPSAPEVFPADEEVSGDDVGSALSDMFGDDDDLEPEAPVSPFAKLDLPSSIDEPAPAEDSSAKSVFGQEAEEDKPQSVDSAFNDIFGEDELPEEKPQPAASADSLFEKSSESSMFEKSADSLELPSDDFELPAADAAPAVTGNADSLFEKSSENSLFEKSAEDFELPAEDSAVADVAPAVTGNADSLFEKSAEDFELPAVEELPAATEETPVAEEPAAPADDKPFSVDSAFDALFGEDDLPEEKPQTAEAEPVQQSSESLAEQVTQAEDELSMPAAEPAKEQTDDFAKETGAALNSIFGEDDDLDIPESKPAVSEAPSQEDTGAAIEEESLQKASIEADIDKSFSTLFGEDDLPEDGPAAKTDAAPAAAQAPADETLADAAPAPVETESLEKAVDGAFKGLFDADDELPEEHPAGNKGVDFLMSGDSDDEVSSGLIKDPTAPLDRGPAELDESLNTRTLAEIYFEQGLVDKALDIYEDLARKEPENAEIMNRLMEVEKAYREKFGGESNG